MDVKARVAEIVRRQHETAERQAAERQHRHTEVARCLAEVVKPALDEFAAAVRLHGRNVTVYASVDRASVIVMYERAEELNYVINPDDEDDIRALVRETESKTTKPWILSFDGVAGSDTIEDLTTNMVLEDVLAQYARALIG